MVTKYNNGDLLKDKITGYEGIVLGVTLYSTGCTHYGLISQKLSKNNTIGDWEWFDETRLSIVKEKVIDFNTNNKNLGGPFPNAPKM